MDTEQYKKYMLYYNNGGQILMPISRRGKGTKIETEAP